MRNSKYTTEEYAELLKPKHIVPLEDYQGALVNIRHKCVKCNYEWFGRPSPLIRNKASCRQCLRIQKSKPLSQVKQELDHLGWRLVNESEYMSLTTSPSIQPLAFKHKCGNVILSNCDRVTGRKVKCLVCDPQKIKPSWSTPTSIQDRTYYSKIESECCEYLISKFGQSDIILHKRYSPSSKRSCDAYIQSIDTYVEISTINKPWYLERIWTKRKLVDRFVFVSSLDQLKSFFP